MNHYTRNELHKKILSRIDPICGWFKDRSSQTRFPIYSSYDIRDAGYKVSNVDANIFPAGFNNICPTDKDSATEIMSRYLDENYGSGAKKIVLITEEHTNNPYYLDNVYTIKSLIESSGRQVRVGFAKFLPESMTLKSANGFNIQIESGLATDSLFKEFKPDLIINNNDFSEPHSEWAKQIQVPQNPPRELGWYQRKKSSYFKFYNQLVHEFSEIAQIDPQLLEVKTEFFPKFDVTDDASKKHLSEVVDKFIENLQREYKQQGWSQRPFVFIKNNAGTYGLAVIKVESGKEILEWSYKSRKKMKAAKGGRDVEEVIIQEGIPSIIEKDGVVSEPVIYMIGSSLAGGFLRTHSEKTSTESLNSPGAVYKRLCVSDLFVRPEGCPMENVYGWTSKLGALAITMEAKEMGVKI